MNVLSVIYKIGKFTKNHRRALLTAGSIAGLGITAYSTYKATCKAKDAIAEEIERRAVHNDNIEEAALDTSEEKMSLSLTRKDKFTLTYKYYITPLLFLLLTTGSIVANSIFDKKDIDKALGLAALGDIMYQEHRDKIKEKFGEDALDEIDKDIALDKAKKVIENEDTNDRVKKRGNKSLKNENNPIKYTSNGGDYFIDSFSGQRFTCNLEYIRKVVNDLNQRCLNHVGEVVLNDYYYELNIDPIDEGDVRGWNYANLIDIDATESIIKDGRAYIVIRFRNRPRYL